MRNTQGFPPDPKLVVDKLETSISGVLSVSDFEHPEIVMAAAAAKAKKSFAFIYL